MVNKTQIQAKITTMPNTTSAATHIDVLLVCALAAPGGGVVVSPDIGVVSPKPPEVLIFEGMVFFGVRTYKKNASVTVTLKNMLRCNATPRIRQLWDSQYR